MTARARRRARGRASPHARRAPATARPPMPRARPRPSSCTRARARARHRRRRRTSRAAHTRRPPRSAPGTVARGGHRAPVLWVGRTDAATSHTGARNQAPAIAATCAATSPRTSAGRCPAPHALQRNAVAGRDHTCPEHGAERAAAKDTLDLVRVNFARRTRSEENTGEQRACVRALRCAACQCDTSASASARSTAEPHPCTAD